jgi:hypothetical protein
MNRTICNDALERWNSAKYVQNVGAKINRELPPTQYATKNKINLPVLLYLGLKCKIQDVRLPTIWISDCIQNLEGTSPIPPRHATKK